VSWPRSIPAENRLKRLAQVRLGLVGGDQGLADLCIEPHLVVDGFGILLKTFLLPPLTPIEQAANNLIVHVDRLVREFLGCAGQKRDQQRLALFFAEAIQVLKGVPCPLARQLPQTALMDGAPHAFIESNGANGAQLLAQPEKIHRCRPADGLA
jgi:hypothetical protein